MVVLSNDGKIWSIENATQRFYRANGKNTMLSTSLLDLELRTTCTMAQVAVQHFDRTRLVITLSIDVESNNNRSNRDGYLFQNVDQAPAPFVSYPT